VAHDFNNILTGILGYAELILSSVPEGDPLRGEMAEILSAAERGAGLTQQLLAFSRKQIITPQRLDLNASIAHSEKLLGRIIGEDIDLVHRPGPDLWAIHADPGQIDQILVNLATNSRDAMPDGGKLTIETVNVEVDDLYCQGNPECQVGDYVILAVSDTGSGMDAATQSFIFEPFFSTKPKDRGTGLGLSTVYGIVKQSGGFIQVYSEPGVGTTVKIGFPRAEGTAELPAERPAEVVHEGTETVLVVEDEEMVRRLAARVLETHGYTVLAAVDAEDAVRRSERHIGEIDLLLTDVVMPGSNGILLFGELSRSRPALKALFMSGYTDDVIAHHGVLKEGMQFLPKPFTARSLTRKVREVLDA
jgi:CheY-like chemotaxis protein